jgi:hypothetical protein
MWPSLPDVFGHVGGQLTKLKLTVSLTQCPGDWPQSRKPGVGIQNIDGWNQGFKLYITILLEIELGGCYEMIDILVMMSKIVWRGTVGAGHHGLLDPHYGSWGQKKTPCPVN